MRAFDGTISFFRGGQPFRAPHAIRRRLFLGSVSLLALTIAPPEAKAQQAEWTGAVSSDWFDPANWSTNAVPITPNDVVISTTSPNGAVVDGATGNVNQIHVATTGDGAVTVKNGGILASQKNLHIGQSNGQTGTAVVSGAGSLLSAHFTLGIGYEGIGSLLIEDGAKAQSEVTDVWIGAMAGSKGTVTVTGAGSTLLGNYGIDVGRKGDGTLEILDGGKAISAGDALSIGSEAGSKGRVLVSGAGSTVEASVIDVGDYGEGSLTIANGGTVDVTGMYVGTREGAVGDVLVTGKGSAITDGNIFYIGNAGKGTFTVADGAEVNVAYTYLGTYEGGVGNLVVTGEGSVYRGYGKVGSIATLDVGTRGDAFVTVSDGGAIISEHNVEVGTGIGTGSVLVTGAGSSFDITASDLRLGTEGFPKGPSRGAFTVEDGASGSVAGGLYIGHDAVGTGMMTVSGTDSTFAVRGNLLAGQAGDGTLSLLDGGVATAGGLTSVGNLEGSTGHMVIDGTGSRLDAKSFVFVGHLGDGEAAVTGGGALDSAGSVSIGGYRESTSAGKGTVTVSGDGSTLKAAGWIDVGGSGTGSLAIADAAHVSAGYGVVVGNLDGSVGLLSIGAGRDASGKLLAAAAPGTLDAGDPANEGGGLLRLGDGDATLLFNHTGTDYDFGTVIGGTGLILHAAGTTTFSADSSAFAGTTRITGGHLDIDGALGGPIDVAGGTLGGTGTLGSVTLGNGATLAPSGTGTLNVAGDVTFNTGSMLETAIAGNGKSGLLDVGGSAQLSGGTVAVTALDPKASYKQGQTYTILTAKGGTQGAFADAFSRSAFITPTLLYPDKNSVQLSIKVAEDPKPEPKPEPKPDPDPKPDPKPQAGLFTRVAGTFNQRESAAGLDKLEQKGDALAVYNQILMLSAPEARAAFDLASGEIHASGQHVTDKTSALFGRTLQMQGKAGLGGVATGSASTAPLAYSGTSRPASLPSGIMAADTPDLPIDAYASGRVSNAWLAPLGGGGKVDADGNGGVLDWRTLGVAGGYGGSVDVAHGRAWAGLGLGYLRSHGEVDARLSELDADTFNIGAYGGWTDGAWTLSGSLAYSASHMDTQRRVVFGGLDRLAEANYWTHSVNFSSEASYAFTIGAGTTLSPLVTLDTGWSGHGSFAETGAGALNLAGASESWTRLDTGLGVALAHMVPTANGVMTFEAQALWEHAFGGVVPSQTVALSGSPAGFVVNGADAGRDRLRLGAGLSFDLGDDLTVRARYEGAFSGRQSDHAASIGINVKF